jgi:hypothetical protein
MNTALIGAGHVSVRPIGHSTLVQRISRTGLALVAWSRSRSRGAERYSREELAELHERRLVAGPAARGAIQRRGGRPHDLTAGESPPIDARAQADGTAPVGSSATVNASCRGIR